MVYTSESVSEGHPDKVADQIADSLLDALMEKDPECRVAIETLLTRGLAVVAGEVTTHAYVDIPEIVRNRINEIGYTDTQLGFDGNTCGVMIAIQKQSPHIAMGVDTGGAGDQGMMFGMATNETVEFMPLPITIAHRMTAVSAQVRKKHPSLGFRPDAKSQVSVVYEDGKAKRIETIVVSQQHAPGDQDAVREKVRQHIIEPVLKEFAEYVDGEIKFHINPTGAFEIGGPQGDTGVTGRKIIVDTYGGLCPHGGGAFSGKDPTKVDRSATYMARHVAKCVVAAGLAERVQITFAYAIGVPQPVSIAVETFGTETIDPAEIERRIRENFDLSPKGIIDHLDLRNPARVKYAPTAKNGHFGHREFTWERTSDADRLK
ncbi:MAG: methionine adenosyltransferase [Fimbriimonadaceae bacterium]|nr:methionine adenosyltransferase [Fimbriimonadaceae bacterium]